MISPLYPDLKGILTNCFSWKSPKGGLPEEMLQVLNEWIVIYVQERWKILKIQKTVIFSLIIVKTFVQTFHLEQSSVLKNNFFFEWSKTFITFYSNSVIYYSLNLIIFA